MDLRRDSEARVAAEVLLSHSASGAGSVAGVNRELVAF
jgi:hypothetical protein